MQFIQTKKQISWQTISSLFLGSFVTFACLYCTQPLIPLFSEQFQVSPAAASLSVSLATGFMAVFMLVAAWISDAKGRKVIMGISLLATAVLQIFIGFSTNFTWLLVLRAIQGMMVAGFPAIAMAYIAEEFDPATSGLVMGIYISGNSIGGLTGRMVVGAVTDFFSWQNALLTIGIISLAAAMWFWLKLPASRNFSPRPRAVPAIIGIMWNTVRKPQLLLLYLIGFLVMGSFVTVYNYIGYPLMAPPYSLSHTVVGLIFVIYLVGTFSSTWLGSLAVTAGRPRVLLLAICIMAAGCLITLGASLLLKIAGIAVFTFGFFGCYSVVSSWVGQCAGNDKASASSLYLFFHYTGASVIGAWGGNFLDEYGWNGIVALTVIALLLALALLAALLLYTRKKACLITP
jgi:YNFM family putative membrane transporter